MPLLSKDFNPHFFRRWTIQFVCTSVHDCRWLFSLTKVPFHLQIFLLFYRSGAVLFIEISRKHRRLEKSNSCLQTIVASWCYHLINLQLLDYYSPDLFPPQTINLSIYHCWCGNKFWQLKSSLKTILSSSQHCNQQPTLFCFTCKLYWLKETAYESSNFLRALALHSIDLEAKICWTVFNGVGVTDCYITIDYIILPFISFLILLQCQRVEVSHGED